MACLRFAIWLSLLFHDLQLFGVRGAYGEWILVPFSDGFQPLKKLQSDENLQLESFNKLIAKRSTDEVQSPQIFKFELNDAKEPDEETKKLIQKRGRELQLQVKEKEVADSTLSKRSKRSAQKTKPQLIPFLITDAKEPDNATKELIRKSRAKELSLVKTKEPASRQSRNNRVPSVATQVIEPMKKGRSKPVAVTTSQNKEPLRQSHVKSVVVSTQNIREPVRKGRVQSVPLTTNVKDSSNQSRVVKDGTSTTRNRQQSNTKSPRKRTRRFAQLTEPRFIKFELHDVKRPDGETGTEIQMLPQPDQRSISMNEMYYNQPNETQHNSDPSTQETKYHYIFKEAPRKQQHYVAYPKRYGHNGMLFRANKMQKYVASGQGLQNINTNIEISIPPTVTTTAVVESLLSEYPKQIYGQKLCPAYGYGNRVCHLNAVQQPPPTQPLQQYSQPAENLDIENEVIPEQHQQQYYLNVYPQQQPDVSQQFIPLAPKPYPTITQIVHVPTIEIPAPQPEPQVAQNLIDTNTVINTDPSIKIAYLEPTYGYGNKIYPYTVAKNIQVAPTAPATMATEHSSMGSFDPGADQVLVEPHTKNINNVDGQYNSLKDNQEFQELSALIGKSPTDQVHGLSYLLAKEMQRQKNHNSQRPQDQTSPILFHPKDNMTTASMPMPMPMPLVQQQQHFQIPQEQSNQMLMPFRQHRQLHRDKPEQDTQSTLVTHANSRLSANDVKALGLSPNYHGLDGHNNNFSPPKTYPEVESDSAMEYASKYAFGYRVRDFDSGNDFAHKQNRGKDGVTRGQYHILLPDGRIQNVIYYADDTGFHADVSY